MRRGATVVGWTGRLIAMGALLICTHVQGQGIFDFDEPPATPSTSTTPPGAGTGSGTGTSTAQPPAIDLKPGPRPAPPDRSYLFPPIAWEDATRGVVHLTTPPPVAPGAANKPAPVAPDLGEVPPIRPANVAALRRRYVELISEQQVRDIDSVYGDDERRAAGKPAELMALVATLKAAAKDVTDQPVMKRYLLLRAFEVARRAGAAEGVLLELAGQIRPLLGKELPAEVLQRAELEGAIADAVMEARHKGQPVSTLHLRASWAARAFYEVAYWQEQHYYLAEGTDSLARAEYYAKAGNVDDLQRVCGLLRTLLQDWTRLRGTFLEKYHAYRAAPEDPKANAEYARAMMIVSKEVPFGAVQALAKSNDPNLKAVGQAVVMQDPAARDGAVGMALLPLIDAATGKDKSILTQIAVRHLDRLVKSGRTADPNYTKGRLYLSRLKATLTENEVAAATGGEAGSGAGGGENGGGGNPVFVETSAHRVIYVLDGSGSMMNKFDALRRLVDRAVGELKPTQYFNVIVTKEQVDGGGELFSNTYVAATDTNKTAFYAFMKRTQPHGGADSISAMRVAFAQGAQEIYLVTDGDFPSKNQIVAEIGRLNATKRTKVHTIAFVEQGTEYERILKAIADQNGGTFRAVTDADLRQTK